MGAYGGGAVAGGRSALLPAPAQNAAGKAAQRPQSRPANGAKDTDGTPVTVFIGK